MAEFRQIAKFFGQHAGQAVVFQCDVLDTTVGIGRHTVPRTDGFVAEPVGIVLPAVSIGRVVKRDQGV